ncbi:MAG: hypothetical protein QM723_17175 [Myxococcaceae bacterium]
MSSDVAIEALLPEARAPLGATCAAHSDRAAVGICARCGGFVCRAELIVYDRKAWCPKCCELPDVEWLEIYRRSRVGKLSGGVVWVVATSVLVGLASIAILSVTLPHQAMPRPAQVALVFGALCGVGSIASAVLYVRRAARVRWVLPALNVASMLVTFIGLVGASGSDSRGTELGLTVSLLLLAVLMLVFVGSTRATLFFGGSVSREKLVVDYLAYGNNPLANVAMMLALWGVLMPAFSLPAHFVARAARRAVDPLGNPPSGRKVEADRAYYLSFVGILSAVVWAFVLLSP